MRTKQIFNKLSGITFVVMGAFLVADASSISQLPSAKNGEEKVSFGKKTKSHSHKFLSIYQAKNLNLVSCETKITIPKESIVIVPEGVPHSWVPKGKRGGTVASLDDRHRKQVVV